MRDKLLEGIDEYQLNQVTKDSYQLHLVSPRTDKAKLSKEAREVLTELYGEEAKVSIVFEQAITTLPSGSPSQALFPINIKDFWMNNTFSRERHKQSGT